MAKNTKTASSTKKSKAGGNFEKSRRDALAVTQANLARIEAKEKLGSEETGHDTVPLNELFTEDRVRAGASKPAKRAKGGKHAKSKQSKRLSALDAAAQVLGGSKQAMTCQDMIKVMAEKRLWSSPGGKTPHATLYAAIIREISTQGKDSRFKKVDRGAFALVGRKN